MYTLDAGVLIRAEQGTDGGSQECQKFLEQIKRQALPIYVPSLLLAELGELAIQTLQDLDQALDLIHSAWQNPITSGRISMPYRPEKLLVWLLKTGSRLPTPYTLTW